MQSIWWINNSNSKKVSWRCRKNKFRNEKCIEEYDLLIEPVPDEATTARPSASPITMGTRRPSPTVELERRTKSPTPTHTLRPSRRRPNNPDPITTRPIQTTRGAGIYNITLPPTSPKAEVNYIRHSTFHPDSNITQITFKKFWRYNKSWIEYILLQVRFWDCSNNYVECWDYEEYCPGPASEKNDYQQWMIENCALTCGCRSSKWPERPTDAPPVTRPPKTTRHPVQTTPFVPDIENKTYVPWTTPYRDPSGTKPPEEGPHYARPETTGRINATTPPVLPEVSSKSPQTRMPTYYRSDW